MVPLPSAISPALQFKTETLGTGPPAGHAIRLPAALGVMIVNWNETASAPAGIPHCAGTPGTVPVIWNDRVPVSSEGGPAWPENPWPARVSAIRHGVIATKGIAGVTSAIVRIPPPETGGVQVGGA